MEDQAKGGQHNTYKTIPVMAAYQLANSCNKAIIVIAGWDREFERLHVTTYGGSPEEKERAAIIGETLAQLICGADAEKMIPFEDYRFVDQGRRAVVMDKLVTACAAADYAIASIMAVRDGITDEALQDVRDAIAEAMNSKIDEEIREKK